MGVDYKCDVCGECIADCSESVYTIAEVGKDICEDCLDKHLKKEGHYDNINFSYDGSPGVFNENEEVLPKYTPFAVETGKKLHPVENRYLIRAGVDAMAKHIKVFVKGEERKGVTAIEVIPHVFYKEVK